MLRIPAFIALIVISSLVPVSNASAQAPPAQNPWSFNVQGAMAHQSESDLKDAEGAFAVDRWFVSAGATYSWDRRNALGISIGGGKSDYEFNEETTQNELLNGAVPWGEIEEFRISAIARFKISETGNVIVLPTLRYNGEEGAESGDSQTWGLFAAAGWRINENLTIGPGFGVFSKLEDGTRFFPILFIDWNITDRWSLSTGQGLASSQGPGLTLDYKLSRVWTLGVAGRYENLEFRLGKDGPAPGGIGKDKSFPLVFMAKAKPSEKTSFNLFAGIEFGGKLKLKNEFDELIQESKYDPALIIGMTAELRF